MEDIISSSFNARGMTLQLVKLSINIKIGAKINICIFECVGNIISLHINLNPSARGCNKPLKPTTLGPRLRWIEAITLRSAKVKYATPIKINIILTKLPIIVSTHPSNQRNHLYLAYFFSSSAKRK
jgi:hypothetical protein